MREFVRANGLGLVFGALFLLSVVGQAFAGVAEFNDAQLVGGFAPVSFGQYVTSSDFAVDVAENWQSEYLQFVTYVLFTVYLVQKGSPESKELPNEGRESDKEQKVGPYASDDSPAWAQAGGWRTAVFSRSLVTVMGLIFFGSWLAQSVAGWAAWNVQRLQNLQDPLTWAEYLSAPDFWSRSLQNWQSEFLAVGSMAVLSIYLRQRGSPESKPVGEPHSSTGVSG
ncbi:hypothetical protein M3148_02100 [Georgenia satyanarayanai]|uniref:DUF6766 family protein n=1 Tax=Georgenia satyanarayanai TaxID=860221 RepID=UPI00203FF2DD|nr:DUF6766 family protein [Georgenia satyanarayanai]MCM3659792.1 hypothetical protein [Georgenia satyanarayanai]